MRIVLDTSVLIAALRSNRGAASELLRLALAERLTMVLDLKLTLEYVEVSGRESQRAEFVSDLDELETFLRSLIQVAEGIHDVKLLRPQSSDPSDEMIIELAVAAKVDAIVTNNRRHLWVAQERFAIPVLTPAEALEFFRTGG